MSQHSDSQVSNVEICEEGSQNRKRLINWKKNDKYQLWLGLQYRGPRDVKGIKNDFLPQKTEEEITAAISSYWENAIKLHRSGKLKSKKKQLKTKQLLPLAKWTKLLTEFRTYRELQTETAIALRFIADLENMPDSFITEQIEFRKIYHHLADAIEGKSIPNCILHKAVLSSCLIDTTLVSKTFIKGSQLRNVIKGIKVSEKEFTGFPRATNEPELAIIRALLTLPNYNPLHITEESLLKSSFKEN